MDLQCQLMVAIVLAAGKKEYTTATPQNIQIVKSGIEVMEGFGWMVLLVLLDLA